MVIIKKRNQKSSADELIKALSQFILLLEDQNEEEAIKDLQKAMISLEANDLNSKEVLGALNLIQEAFEGEHELEAYTIPRKEGGEAWSEAEELYLASTSVLTLLRRIRKTVG